MSYRNSKKNKISFLKNQKKLFIVKLISKIYILSLLTVVKIDILDFILSIYLIQKYPDR